MHIPIAIIEESVSLYGFLNVYSDSEQVPKRTLELLRDWAAELRNPEPGSLQQIIDRLHAEYLSHQVEKFAAVREQVGWHGAYSMLSFALFTAGSCWIVHLGNCLVARIEQEEVIRIAPIHEIRYEYAEQTLAEAGLLDLMNLTPAFAEQMVGVSAGTLPQLQDKTPGELAELMGSYNTRVIGDYYFGRLELTSRKAFITSIPLSGELELVMLEPVPDIPPSRFNPFDARKRELFRAMENKWPSQDIDEVIVSESIRMTSRNLGIKIYWQEGHQVEVSLLRLKE